MLNNLHSGKVCECSCVYLSEHSSVLVLCASRSIIIFVYMCTHLHTLTPTSHQVTVLLLLSQSPIWIAISTITNPTMRMIVPKRVTAASLPRLLLLRLRRRHHPFHRHHLTQPHPPLKEKGLNLSPRISQVPHLHLPPITPQLAVVLPPVAHLVMPAAYEIVVEVSCCSEGELSSAWRMHTRLGCTSDLINSPAHFFCWVPVRLCYFARILASV